MGRRVVGTAAALGCLATAHGWATPPPVNNPASEAAMTLSFFVLADWGGQAAPPYTTAEQLGASRAPSAPKGVSDGCQPHKSSFEGPSCPAMPGPEPPRHVPTAAMADSMGRVSASFHPRFVVSAGGNFLPSGLHGASLPR